MPKGGGYFWDHYYRHIYQFYRNSPVFKFVGRGLCIGLVIYWIVFLLVVVIVILATSLTTVDEYDYKDDDDTQYAPLETRLIDVSQTFCDSIELENPSLQMPATAYVLSKGPSLTDEHDYNISESNVTVGGSSYQYWNYYLHHGSSMNASICVQNGSTVEFYIIQGGKKFEHWQDRGGHFVEYMSVVSPCPEAAVLGLDFVDKTDYFFAYASVDGTVTFETNMSFHRKEFGIVEKDIDVEHRCDAGGNYSKKCTVSVPYNDEYYFLLATGNTTSSKGDEDGAAVSWSCKPRVWVYILAFFVPSFLSLVLNTVIVICCLQHRCKCCCCTKLDDNDDVTIMCCTQQCRCDCCCAEIDDNDDCDETSTLTTSTTSFTPNTAAASPSELPNDAPPPYTSATAPQAGYYGKPSHSPAMAYPPMLQPTTHTSTIQNYGATDNNPLY